jgi:flavin reductase (DIM6/NTAB) family NADH-FMN oxidoreductase RutF
MENNLRKKPWNRVSLPVYSISSLHADGRANMHIITYAQAVSMQPKQFIVGIHLPSLTLENVQSNPKFVLQILAADQYRLIDLLGKKTGREVNKIQRLQKRSLLTTWRGFYILNQCLAVMELQATPLYTEPNFEQPDHALFLCNVIAYQNIRSAEPLTTDVLREKGVVRM